MNIASRRLLLLFFSLAVFIQPSAAAFRYVQKGEQKTVAAAPPAPVAKPVHFSAKPSLWRFPRPWQPRTHTSADDRYNKVADGMFAFMCAMFGIVSFAVLGLTSFELFLIPAFILGALATIFGSAGISRHKKVFAILGLTLGLLEIIAAIVVVALI